MKKYYKIADSDEAVIYEIANSDSENVVLKGVNFRRIIVVPKTKVRDVADYDEKKENEEKKIRLRSEFGKKKRSCLLGTVLHIDADQEYLAKTKRLYEEIGIHAYLCLFEEASLEKQIKKLDLCFVPDVIVITGHDSYNEQGKKDIKNYVNSENFSKAVAMFRVMYPNSVIISGACQSNFEALMASGSNFASSPKRVNVHIYDPAIIAIVVCTTSITQIVNFEKMGKYISNLREAYGGIETFGKMKIIY